MLVRREFLENGDLAKESSPAARSMLNSKLIIRRRVHVESLHDDGVNIRDLVRKDLSTTDSPAWRDHK